MTIYPSFYLHPVVDSDQIGAVVVDVIPQRARDLRVDGQEDGDLDKGDQVE